MARPSRKLEGANPKTGMTHEEMKKFVRDHFEAFVNQKNLDIADVNFAPEFVDHGTDVPPGLVPGPAGAKQYVGGAYKKFPDIHECYPRESTYDPGTGIFDCDLCIPVTPL